MILSNEAAQNLLCMEELRHFAGIMNVNTRRVDLAISREIGHYGSERDANMPPGVRYKVGALSPEHFMPLESLHSVGYRDVNGLKVPIDFTGHAMMVKMISGDERHFVGFHGLKYSSNNVRIKWSSRTLNPPHADFLSRYHLGNPGVENRDYILSSKYRCLIIRQFERSGYTVRSDE